MAVTVRVRSPILLYNSTDDALTNRGNASAGVCLPIIVITHGIKRYLEIMVCHGLVYHDSARRYCMALANVSNMP